MSSRKTNWTPTCKSDTCGDSQDLLKKGWSGNDLVSHLFYMLIRWLESNFSRRGPFLDEQPTYSTKPVINLKT
jgi:hypothetical protein